MYSQHEQKVFYEKKHADSVAYAKAHPAPVVDSSKLAATNTAAADTAVADSATMALRALQPAAYNGTEQKVVLENSKLSIEFTTRGAHPVAARLKDYKTYRGGPLNLFDGNANVLSAVLPIDNNRSTASLYFSPVMRQEPNGDKTIDFVADLGNGKKVDLIYTLPANEYMMRCQVVVTGIPVASLPLTWNTTVLPTEKDMVNERMATQVYYQNKDEEHDYFTVAGEEKSIDNKSNAPHWLGIRKQYFSTALIADEGFSKMESKFAYKENDTTHVAVNRADMMLPLKAVGSTYAANMRWYIGPNDYRTLKAYKIGLHEMVPLGVGIMAFVKYINQFAIIPIFYFFASFVKNYAIIILLMTIFIRLILSFFTYKSYLSSAKMRVLKPELDELRAQCGDDQQKFGMEQMKLYRSAGVNPLGGCLPMLFQLPILLSIYYIFPSFIEFRQTSFLWAKDLSTYDSILNFGFNIPFYGDHVSLFTLLMTASSLFLAVYNRNMTPQDPNNPALKYMPYIFPFMLLFIFNKLPSALTWYYTVSNVVTLGLQFVIQNYIIDHDKILAKIEVKRKTPKTKSKWQERYDQMMESQKKIQDLKDKTPKKK